MNETMTRSQRTRKINSKRKNLTKENKEELSQKILDDLESDNYEKFVSSEESNSEFEAENESDSQKIKHKVKKRGKKRKRTKRDKRSLLTKSKVNLQQMISEMKRKGSNPRVLQFEEIQSPRPAFNKARKICKNCFSVATYTCPRWRENYCSEYCYSKYKEFVYQHIDYNYFY